MEYDPFSILPDKLPEIVTGFDAFHATNPIDPTPQVRTIPASLVNDGRTGGNMPSNIGEGLEKELANRREGRMTLFNLERASMVIEGVENGETMNVIAEKIGTVRQTIWSWLQLSPEFRDAVARAREFQGHAAADDAVKILDDVDITGTDAKQNMAALRKAEQRARIRMQLAGCFNFAQYGTKKQNLNLNLNADVCPVDLSKYS